MLRSSTLFFGGRPDIEWAYIFPRRVQAQQTFAELVPAEEKVRYSCDLLKNCAIGYYAIGQKNVNLSGALLR